VTREPDLIDLALREDLGDGDATTLFFVDLARRASASIVARVPCVLSGIGVAMEVFRRVDPSLDLTPAADGTRLAAGDSALRIRGLAAPILTAERTALNFLQRLSGVATITARYVGAVAGTGARILDTRKTTPGFRVLEKAAVASGGGTNHRFGLYDAVMVKDNHLAAGAGTAGLQASIDRARAARPGIKIELEADSLDQVRAFSALSGVDVILLDNMSPAMVAEAVACRRDGLLFEASGGITIGNVRDYALAGVDFISIGALTHSAPSVDLALDFDPAPGGD